MIISEERAKQKVIETIQKRITKRLKQIDWKGVTNVQFYVAGNCLNEEEPRDYDFFPIFNGDFARLKREVRGLLVSVTKNAWTIKQDEKILQFCRKGSKNLDDLINSFDFSHVKAGAHVMVMDEEVHVVSVIVSPTYFIYRITGETQYEGNGSPLQSLFRSYKFYKRGYLKNPGTTIVDAITDMLNRDYDSFEDFAEKNVIYGETVGTVAMKKLYTVVRKSGTKKTKHKKKIKEIS